MATLGSAKYRVGLIIAKCQPLHNGHIRIINDALMQCDEVIFSVDGLRDTAGLYRVNMSPEDHDQIIEVMKMTTKYKFRARWVFIPFKTNEHQISEAIKIADEIGITFELKKSSRWDGPNDPYLPTDKSLISSYSNV